MRDFDKALKACSKIRSDLTECDNSLWAIEKFDVTKEDCDFFNLRENISGIQGGSIRKIKPGEYTILIR